MIMKIFKVSYIVAARPFDRKILSKNTKLLSFVLRIFKNAQPCGTINI